MESLNTYTDDGWDWDIAIGAKIPKGAIKAVKALFEILQSLKGVKQFGKTGKKGEAIKSLVESIIKNLKGGLPSDNRPFIIILPVPFTGPGLHLWVGKKASQHETFWATEFGVTKK